MQAPSYGRLNHIGIAAKDVSETAALYRDTFGCDRALFSAFLAASDWPIGDDFARRTLGLALYRQAVGLTQHHSMDVFEPIAARFPLNDIATLEELADVLFAP